MRRVSRRDARCDDGFALPLALVTVVVLAVTFTAIAGFERTTVRSQTVLADKADIDLAADSAIDAAISALEVDAQAGQYQVGESTTPGETQACAEFDSAFVYPDDGLAGDVSVECFADPDSVSAVVTAGEPPDFVIRAVGGMEGTGDLENGGNTEAPYCDDYQSSGTSCEAGVFIGMGVNADPGGLVVTPNDPSDLDPEPLIQSNGSIISRRETTTRTLNVQGTVAARRVCPDVQATGGAMCNQPGTWWDIPTWRHELWDQTVDDLERLSTTWDTFDPDGPGGVPQGNGTCADRFAIFEPGWYSQMALLNSWTDACPQGTTFWFTPGTYYFDFTDVGGSSPNYWEEPDDFSQFVGGTPQGWIPCAPCAQPTKVMRPEAVSASTAWSMPTGASNIGDGSQAQLEFLVASGGPTRTITYRKPRAPLPTSNTVSGVTLRVAEHHDDVAALYAAPPTVTVEIEGVSGASCEISLLTTTAQEFDLPQDCTVRAGSFPASAADWSTHAEWINNLKATFSVRREGSATPNVFVDGIEFAVSHHGAPAPDFPDACERGKPGVQLIFGNLSRMKFKGNDVHMELCGSRGNQDSRALVAYGLTKETTPAALVHSSGHVGAGGDWTSELLSSANFAVTTGGLVAGNGPAGQSQEWEQIGDGRTVWTDPSWLGGGSATLSFKLPSDFIPAGSAVETVRCRMAHAEPRVNAFTANNITSLIVAVDKPLGSTLDLSDPDGGSSNGICTFSRYQPADAYVPPGGGGDYSGPLLVATSADSDLSPNLRTSNALNGATVLLTVNGNAGVKSAVIEGLEIEVDYRPPGTLRPLRGCMTIRVGYSAATSDLAQFKGINAIHNWMPYVTTTDAAFLDDNGATDVNACAMMNVQSSSSGVGTRLHISGTVYAPTAALQFTGDDNNAELVTDGVLARHISVLRYREDGAGVGFGGGAGVERGPRQVILVAWHGGECVARAVVEFENTDADAREEAHILAWERRPQECAPE